MTKAEEAANKRYPIHPFSVTPQEGEHGEILNFDEWLEDFRIGIQSFSANGGFQQGYEQAEKDLELTWQDIEIIDKILGDVGRQYVDTGFPSAWNSEEFFQEVLRRFKEAKK